MQFEWDEAKAAGNWKKHGVTFAEAVRVFLDLYRVEDCSEAADGESRFKTIGVVRDTELVVVYTERNGSIRLISARRAEKHEQREYWKDRDV